MAISDTITSMYENVGNVYDVLELAGADLTNVDKNIQNLKQSWEERLLYFLANGTDTLWNNWLPKVTGTGETITLNNTIEAKMDFVYKGNTKQSILPSGYTQVDYIESSGIQYIDTGYYLNSNNLNIKTKIYTPNMPSGEQDILSNQDYATGRFTLGLYNYHVFGYSKNADTDDYNVDSSTFSGGQTLDIELDYNWTTHQKSLTVNGTTTTANYNKSIINSNKTIKVLRNGAEDSPNVNVFIGRMYSMQIKVDNQLKFNFIPCYRNSDNAVGLYDLVSNTFYGNSGTGTFTYGSIAPTPDTPIPVQVVSGDNTIKVEGKNLLSEIEQGTINSSGEPVSSPDAIRSKNFDSVIPNTQYTVSINGTKTPINVAQYDSNKTFISYTFYAGTFTTSPTTKYVKISKGGSVSDLFQIEKGSTASSYQPYQSQSYPISLGSIELCKIGNYQDSIKKSTGKNLFDKDDVIIGYYLNNDGTNSSYTNDVGQSNFIKVNPNTTYTIKGSKFGNLPAYCFYDSNKSFISGTSYSYETIKTFTTPSNCYYFKTSFFTSSLNDIQLEENNQATSYEPYGKVWYLNKQIGKVVLDGSETSWETFENASTGNTRLFGVNDYDNIPRKAYIGLSNYFTNSSSTIWSVDYEAMTVNNTGTSQIRFRINKTIADSIEAFTTWLSTHNTTVYYVLETPTTTEITDTTLISQLEATKKSCNNQTNISQTNADKPFILDVTALGN